MSLTVRGPGMSFVGLRASEDAYARGISRVSSGLRLTRAADDAAGLAISQRMRSQVTGSAMATRNVQNGIDLLQTAEGGLSAMTAILQRARELAVQTASTGSMTADDRAAAAAEVRQLVSEIDRTARTTSFNGQRMLDGSRPGGFVFQVGAGAGDVLGVGTHDLTADALLLSGLTTVTSAAAAVTTYTTRSAVLGSYDTTKQGADQARNFSFTVGGTVYADVIVPRRNYTGDNARLVQDLRTAMDGAAIPVLVDLTSDGRLQFTAKPPGDATVRIEVGGAGAEAIGGITTTSTTSEPVITTTTTAAGPSLGDLVGSGNADAISLCDDALTAVLGARSELGATQNRMEHRLSALATTQENLDAARSRIEDADIAKEYAGLVRAQVLSQAGTALQAQGGQRAQRVLQLLGSL